MKGSKKDLHSGDELSDHERTYLFNNFTYKRTKKLHIIIIIIFLKINIFNLIFCKNIKFLHTYHVISIIL